MFLNEYGKVLLEYGADFTYVTNAEASRSILMPNPIFSKPGLDPARMAIFKDAVSAKFQVSPTHWNTFLQIVSVVHLHN
ncbi:unnamed protein product [Didymodactylos carnosus]|uniref:Uncharacterized protein n=2 Tax=Didymodactylos carnosus TaxID=1234261 RepID=A0A814P1A6_9BILA|nr:unnamed protein product [Didymodactylos carnosus]CAF3864406.1 unnamed protein product [Didymodactylos carnosus]